MSGFRPHFKCSSHCTNLRNKWHWIVKVSENVIYIEISIMIKMFIKILNKMLLRKTKCKIVLKQIELTPTFKIVYHKKVMCCIVLNGLRTITKRQTIISRCEIKWIKEACLLFAKILLLLQKNLYLDRLRLYTSNLYFTVYFIIVDRLYSSSFSAQF